MHSDIKREELLISQLSDLLVNDKHVAVGAASPIPGAAALLAKEEAKLNNKRLERLNNKNTFGKVPIATPLAKEKIEPIKAIGTPIKST